MSTKTTYMIAAVAMSVLAGTANAANGEPLRVLAIGNSFSKSVVTHLPGIAVAEGKELDILNLYKGGCSLQEHWENHDKTGLYSEFNKSAVSSPSPFAGLSNSSSSLDAVLAAVEWDIVTLQQNSENSPTLSTYEPYFGHLVALIKEKAPNAKIWIQQTWSWAEPKTADSDAMYGALAANYSSMQTMYSIENQIPSGYAVQLYRHTYKTSPLGTDNQHLSKPDGEYLQACVWAGELFDINPSEITYVPSGMDATTAGKLKSVAAQAVVATDYSRYKNAQVSNETATAFGRTFDLVEDGISYHVSEYTTMGTDYELTIPADAVVVDLLLVGGGGGGGGLGGGGGGAVYLRKGAPLVAGSTYTVSVGAGGAGTSDPMSRGTSGTASSVNREDFSVVAAGGGGGGGWSNAGTSGANGGGGSPGDPNKNPVTGTTAPSAWHHQGFTGGAATNYGKSSTGCGAGGGGAGASENGANSQVTNTSNHNDTTVEAAGAGGAGYRTDISGVSVCYGGGGGGGVRRSNFKIGGNGGEGGGGTGFGATPGEEGPDGSSQTMASPRNATTGTDGLGGGGGGGGWDAKGNAYSSAKGGSGVVLVRYALASENEDKVHTVRFLGHGDVVIKTQQVLDGSPAFPPASAEVDTDDKVFFGWDSSYSSVTSDLDVRAMFSNRKVRIFDSFEKFEGESGSSVNGYRGDDGHSTWDTSAVVVKNDGTAYDGKNYLRIRDADGNQHWASKVLDLGYLPRILDYTGKKSVVRFSFAYRWQTEEGMSESPSLNLKSGFSNMLPGAETPGTYPEVTASAGNIFAAPDSIKNSLKVTNVWFKVDGDFRIVPIDNSTKYRLLVHAVTITDTRDGSVLYSAPGDTSHWSAYNSYDYHQFTSDVHESDIRFFFRQFQFFTGGSGKYIHDIDAITIRSYPPEGLILAIR